MNSVTRLALAGALALSVLAPADASEPRDKYQQDLTRVVQKYDGAANVPAGSVSFLAKYYDRSSSTIRDDLAAAEAELHAPPELEPAPEPEDEPASDYASYYAAAEDDEGEEASSDTASYYAGTVYSESSTEEEEAAPAGPKERPPASQLEARKARIRAVFRSIDEGHGATGRSWVYHQYTDRDRSAYLDDMHVVDVDGDHRLEMSGGNILRDDVNFRASVKGSKAKMSVEHDGIPHMFVKDGRSIFAGAGTNALTLDDSFRAGATGTTRWSEWTQAIAQSPLLDVGFLRERTNLDVDLYGEDRNTVFQVTRDRRSGSRVGYSYDGDRYELPVPIEYQTTDYNLSTERSVGDFWYRIGFLFSDFRNDNDTLTWESASRIVDGGQAATNLMDLAPENRRHMLSFAGSLRNLAKSGRLNFTDSTGKMKQDDALVPYSSNPLSGAPALPQQTADQEVETTQYRADYSMRPSKKSRLKLGYRGYEYEDKGSQIAFGGSASDDGTFSADATGARTTEHLSYEKRTLDLGFSYDLDDKNTAQLRYSLQDTDRENREVSSQQEDTVEFLWDSRPNDRWQLRFSALTADRDHDGYDFLAPFRHQTPVPTTPNNNVPFARKYAQASRERDQLQLSATYLPKEDVAITFTGMTGENDYDEPATMGLKSEEEDLYGIDVDYRPVGGRYGLNVFANLEERSSRFDGRAWRSGWTGDPYNDPGAATAAPIASDWTLDQTDDVETFGLRFDWTFEPETLSSQFGWNRSKSDGNFAFSSPVGGVAASALPGGASTGLVGPDQNNYVPGTLAQMSDMTANTYDLRFDYQIRDRRSLSLGVRHETFEWQDWEVLGWTSVGHGGTFSENGQLFIDQRPKDFENTTVWFSYGLEF